MHKLTFLLLLAILAGTGRLAAQNNVHVPTDKEFIGKAITELAGQGMHGRGYVENGRDDAAKYIQKRFKDSKLRAFKKTPNYLQGYSFPVNTFPGKMTLVLNKKELTPGEDYIIDAASCSFAGEKLSCEQIDLAGLIKINDSTEAIDSAQTDSTWTATCASISSDHIYYLDHADSFCRAKHIKPRNFTALLPKGCYIIPAKEKLTWDVSTDTILATVFYVKEASLPKNIKSASVSVRSLFVRDAHSDNIIGCVPGKVTDTFLAITAHYDHLGMMGDTTVFPGASDNASGTAMMLYLADYFSRHPTRYSLLFIAFSGEEAGLMGSAYYVTHPIVPLKNIKFLTNIDIMGDATDGITVVNATEFPDKFSLLQRINNAGNYIPDVKSRGKTSNSDHYFFYEKGVPSFFIYSDGGGGYYHDIYDKPHEVTLNHIDGVASLLIDFLQDIK